MKKITLKFWRIKFFIEFLKLSKKSSKESDLVLFIPRVSLSYFLRTNFLWDLATMRYLKTSKINYRVVKGLKKLSNVSSSKVIYNPGYNLNDWNVENDVAFYPLISNLLESQANEVIPSSDEIIYWENKAFMYNAFLEKKIPMPDTFVVNSNNYDEFVLNINVEDNWLYKPNHSKSSIGIVEVKTNIKDFVLEKLKNHKYVVLQKIIDIDRDCRIIVINDKIVLQYWRNKVESDGWIPTSTSTGSTVTFMNYPESLEEWVVSQTNKLGLRSAAWDIVFENTDLRMEKPLALEVSPVYYPNPRENYDPDSSYNDYKKSFNYERYLLNEFETHIKAKVSKWITVY